MTISHLAEASHRAAVPAVWKHYQTQPPHTVAGDLRWIRSFGMPQLHTRRTVSVWLPPGYGHDDRRYPVFYMFDGQNLFDAARAFGHNEWHVDESMLHLSREGLPAIVVAVDHGGERRVREYTPFGHGQGEATLDFFEQTLIPRVEADFRTLGGPQGRIIAGSSMGGLMSLHALITRPHLFGAAGVFSPALWPGHRAIFDVVRKIERPVGRIYIDNGTAEPSAHAMTMLLKSKGYVEGETLHVVVDKGGVHSESAWARRFPGAARFLLSGAA